MLSKAAIKGRFYAEKSKLEFMTEQNRLRNNQILAESANRVYLKEQEVVKGFGKIPKKAAVIFAIGKGIGINKRLLRIDFNIFIRISLNEISFLIFN